MKRFFVLIILFSLCISATVNGEGALPALSDAYGIPMPSLGDVLNRYPDTEVKKEDGSTKQSWNNILNKDFEAFSKYLGTINVSLLDYTVNNGIFTAVIAKDNKTFTFIFDSQKQTATVIYPQGTFDEREYEAESHYNIAKELLSKGRYLDAYYEFVKIKDFASFKDVGNILKNENMKLKPYKTVGGIVSFGYYEQDNNPDNGKEAIEWIVMEVQGNKCMLLSMYLLEYKQFSSIYNNPYVWETSTLRGWLNHEFLDTAFTSTEQNAILITDVDNSSKQHYTEYRTRGGNNTKDKVFLLSYAEAHKYFDIEEYHVPGSKNNMKSRAAATEYARVKFPGLNYDGDEYKMENGKYALSWWLRSPGYNKSIAEVYRTGCLWHSEADSGNFVRPVLWLDLDSGIIEY